MGSRRLYDFIDDNPTVAMLDVAYVNDTAVIRRNPRVTAINSAIEVDLTGQVCADSIGLDSDSHHARSKPVSLFIALANSRMVPLKKSVSKKKFRATTSLGAASSIGR